MTYDSLVADILSYAERSNDPAFIEKVPRFIMLAENRIAVEVKCLGLQKTVTDVMDTLQPVIIKPTRWRETISFNFGTGVDLQERNFLLERSYEFCRAYWPNPTKTGTPKYYANYDWEHFIVVPTPVLAHPFELLYYERPTPLSTENQTNWTTENAPQLILFGSLLQAQPFLKNATQLQTFGMMYDQAVSAIDHESKTQTVDRSSIIDKGGK